MTPAEMLALMQVLARQQQRIVELEAEVARLREQLVAALTKDNDGVPG